MKDEYRAARREARAKIAVGACRFIASVSPCGDEQEARRFINKITEEFSDATHNAYAYRLGLGGQIARCDDDGEPAGTAGPPILGVLEKYGLTNTVLVGTRYFGGVKLGIGGLIRAYRACAEAGINASGSSRYFLRIPLIITVPYEHLGHLHRALSAFQGEVIERQFARQVRVSCLIRAGERQPFEKKLLDLTRGKAVIEKGKY